MLDDDEQDKASVVTDNQNRTAASTSVSAPSASVPFWGSFVHHLHNAATSIGDSVYNALQDESHDEKSQIAENKDNDNKDSDNHNSDNSRIANLFSPPPLPDLKVLDFASSMFTSALVSLNQAPQVLNSALNQAPQVIESALNQAPQVFNSALNQAPQVLNSALNQAPQVFQSALHAVQQGTDRLLFTESPVHSDKNEETTLLHNALIAMGSKAAQAWHPLQRELQAKPDLMKLYKERDQHYRSFYHGDVLLETACEQAQSSESCALQRFQQPLPLSYDTAPFEHLVSSAGRLRQQISQESTQLYLQTVIHSWTLFSLRFMEHVWQLSEQQPKSVDANKLLKWMYEMTLATAEDLYASGGEIVDEAEEQARQDQVDSVCALLMSGYHAVVDVLHYSYLNGLTSK